MSCAVMFQPCVAAEQLSVPSIKPQIEPPQSIIAGSQFYRGGVPQTTQTGYPMFPYRQSTQQNFQESKSCMRRPSEERETGKALKKLCTSVRNFESTQDEEFRKSPSKSNSKQNTTDTEKNIKYLSANCVLVTHYQGETSAVVDEHFTRALAPKSRESQSSFKLSARNLPASFFQPGAIPRPSFAFAGAFGAHSSSDLYDAYHGAFHSFQTDNPWVSYPFGSQAYCHRGVGSDAYHSAMAQSHPYHQYSTLGLSQHFPRIPSVPVPHQMMKSESWSSRYYDSFSNPEFSNETATYNHAAHFHPATASGLDTSGSSDCSKEQYWLT